MKKQCFVLITIVALLLCGFKINANIIDSSKDSKTENKTYIKNHIKYTYYNNGNIHTKKTFYRSDSLDIKNIYCDKYHLETYDIYGKLISKSIVVETDNDIIITTSIRNIYYDNGLLKQQLIYKRNQDTGQLTKTQRYTYTNQGIIHSSKVRLYKAGTVLNQKYYRFNIDGVLKESAYRIEVNYSKQGTALIAKQAKYNYKGQLQANKIINNTKEIVSW